MLSGVLLSHAVSRISMALKKYIVTVEIWQCGNGPSSRKTDEQSLYGRLNGIS